MPAGVLQQQETTRSPTYGYPTNNPFPFLMGGWQGYGNQPCLKPHCLLSQPGLALRHNTDKVRTIFVVVTISTRKVKDLKGKVNWEFPMS